MVPDKDDPPESHSSRRVFKHISAAFSHVGMAFLRTHTLVRRLLTSRPPLAFIWNGLFGRRRQLSAIAVLFAPISAVVTALLVTATYGYSRIEQWVIGETHTVGQWVVWAVTAPQTLALVGILLLVMFAATFSAKNSGLVPTILLVMGPIFGIGLSRYGMMIEHFSPSKLHRHFGATAMHFETVGPMETIGTALFLALLWGIPIGVTGFTVGVVGRRSNGLFGRSRNGNTVSEV